MAKIDEETIRKIKESNDIVEVIGYYLSLTPKGKNYFSVCPFHDDHSPSMSISPDKQIYRCFVCGANGNVITFVKDYLKVSFIEALDILSKRANLNLKLNINEPDNSPYKESYDIYKLALSYYKNNLNTKSGEEARKYLEERNLTKETIDYFDIGLSLKSGLSSSLAKTYNKDKLIALGLAREDLSDLFTNRIMFTIRDNHGFPVAFSARTYQNLPGEPKYINSRETEIFKKGKVLYNFYRAKDYIRKEREVIINEGFMEVIRLHTIGIDNAVALMGTSFTTDHLEIIKNLKVKVVLNLDQDDAGKLATIVIGKMLIKENINPTVIIFKGAKDADELIVNKGKEEFINSYNARVSFIDFYLDYLKKDKDLTKAEDITKYINESVEVLDLINDDILKSLKIKEIGTKFDIDENIIKNKLKITTVSNNLEVPPPNKEIKKIKYNKYDISEIRLLYLMLNNPNLIKYYEINLGYLNDDNRRILANSIINYKEKYKTFDYSDFICYTITRPELDNTLKTVMSYPHLESYTMEEVDDYIKAIKELRVQKQIDKLTRQMKETIDAEEKKRLASRINNMKKEVLKW